MLNVLSANTNFNANGCYKPQHRQRDCKAYTLFKTWYRAPLQRKAFPWRMMLCSLRSHCYVFVTTAAPSMRALTLQKHVYELFRPRCSSRGAVTYCRRACSRLYTHVLSFGIRYALLYLIPLKSILTLEIKSASSFPVKVDRVFLSLSISPLS